MDSLDLINRLGGKIHPTLSSTITSLLIQPLFMHQSFIDPYVRAALLAGNESDIENKGIYNSGVPVLFYPEIKTTVINVSGALTARKIKVECAASPASYSEIKKAIAKSINDSDFIVLRVDSGGGVASQMADLSRWIKSKRNTVRLIGCIDDNAYSAAYGLVSACDTIYCTETSGAGSVGVVLRSETNLPTEGDVDYFIGGEKKIDGAHDLPLSDNAKKEYQQEVDRLYVLFSSLVADNMGLTLEKVQSMQAGTYHGKSIIDNGLAHKFGNFETIINNIWDGEEMTINELKQSKLRLEAQRARIEAATTKADDFELYLKTEESKLDVADESKLDIADKSKLDVVDNSKLDLEKELAELKAENEKLKAENEESLEKDVEAEKLEARNLKVSTMCASAGVDDSITKSMLSSSLTIEEVSNMLTSISANTENNIDGTKGLNLKGDKPDLKASWKKAFKNVKL